MIHYYWLWKHCDELKKLLSVFIVVISCIGFILLELSGLSLALSTPDCIIKSGMREYPNALLTTPQNTLSHLSRSAGMNLTINRLEVRTSAQFQNRYNYAVGNPLNNRKSLPMPINKQDLEQLVVDTLTMVELETTPELVQLLLLTSAQESGLGTYIVQSRGPALGIFQMEPATHRALWKRLIEHCETSTEWREYTQRLLTTLVPQPLAHSVLTSMLEGALKTDQLLPFLRSNLMYATIMARLRYKVVPESIPSGLNNLAAYWKKYYNTSAGKGRVDDAIKNYRRYVDADA